jgi:hypothetical protein
MKIILAMDNDSKWRDGSTRPLESNAGYQSVFRMLEREISKIDLPLPSPDEMGLITYKTWLKDIVEYNSYPVSLLLWELNRLKEKDCAEDIDKVEMLNKAFTLCKINQSRKKFLKALND